MDEEYKVGDIVRLKCGGPRMTIDKLGTFSGGSAKEAKCLWFAEDKIQSAVFPIVAVEKVEG